MGYSENIKVSNLPITAFGDLRIAQLNPQFQGSFEYTVDNTELTTNFEIAGGTVTQGNAMSVCNTSVTTGSTAYLQSRRHARYRSGLGGLSRFTALFTTPVLATEQYIGLRDELGSSVAFKNGLMLGYDGTTFGFHRFANDTKETILQSSWDDPLDGTGKSGQTLIQTNLNIWFIRFQYLGAGAMELWWESPDGEVHLVHVIHYANQNTVPSSFNPNYHFVIHVSNKATTADLTVKCASYSYFIEGKTKHFEVHQPEFSTGKVQKTGVTTEVALFTIRNKATYAGRINYIDVIMKNLTSAIEAGSANNLGEVRFVRNATLGGTPSYSDINTTDSVIEIDIAGTTVTGGKESFFSPLAGKNDRIGVNLNDYDLILAPNETMTLAVSSTNSATIGGSALWGELF